MQSGCVCIRSRSHLMRHAIYIMEREYWPCANQLRTIDFRFPCSFPCCDANVEHRFISYSAADWLAVNVCIQFEWANLIWMRWRCAHVWWKKIGRCIHSKFIRPRSTWRQHFQTNRIQKNCVRYINGWQIVSLDWMLWARTHCSRYCLADRFSAMFLKFFNFSTSVSDFTKENRFFFYSLFHDFLTVVVCIQHIRSELNTWFLACVRTATLTLYGVQRQTYILRKQMSVRSSHRRRTRSSTRPWSDSRFFFLLSVGFLIVFFS